jgi:hypothetical protein
LKTEAPRMENEFNESPARMLKIINIAGLVFGKRPNLAMIEMIIQEGK